jgi:hypothetical protein
MFEFENAQAVYILTYYTYTLSRKRLGDFDCIYVNQSLAGQTLAELTDLHSMNNQKRGKENYN